LTDIKINVKISKFYFFNGGLEGKMAFKVIKNGEKKKKVSPIYSFVGREDEKAYFFANYEYLQKNYEESESKVLCYYGFSNMGKTALCKQIIDELGDRKHIYYDFESGADISSFLKSTVVFMKKKYGYSFLLYEYALYLVSDEKVRNAIDSSFLTYIKKLMDRVPTENIVDTLLVYANSDDVVIRKFLDNYRDDLKQIEMVLKTSSHEKDDIDKLLVTCYAKDFMRNQANENKPFIIFLDSYERIINPLNSAGNSEQSDLWLRSIEDGNEGLMLMLPNVLWVIASRDRLRWNKYDPIWDENALEQHELGVLLEEDAIGLINDYGLENMKKAKKLHKLAQGNPKHMILATKAIMDNNMLSLEDAINNQYDVLVDDFMRGYRKNIRNAFMVLCNLSVWTDKNLEKYMKKTGIKISRRVCEIIKKSGYVFVEKKTRYEIVPYLKDILLQSSYVDKKEIDIDVDDVDIDKDRKDTDTFDNFNEQAMVNKDTEFVSDIVLKEKEFEKERKKREEKYEQILDEQKKISLEKEEIKKEELQKEELEKEEIEKAIDELENGDDLYPEIKEDFFGGLLNDVDFDINSSKSEKDLNLEEDINLDSKGSYYDKYKAQKKQAKNENERSLVNLDKNVKEDKNTDPMMSSYFKNNTEGINLKGMNSLKEEKLNLDDKKDLSIEKNDKAHVLNSISNTDTKELINNQLNVNAFDKAVTKSLQSRANEKKAFKEKIFEDTASIDRKNYEQEKASDNILDKYTFEEPRIVDATKTDKVVRKVRANNPVKKPVIRDNKVHYEVTETGEIDDVSKYGSRLTEEDRDELMKDVSKVGNNPADEKKNPRLAHNEFKGIKSFEEYINQNIGKISFCDLYEDTYYMFETMLKNKQYADFKRIFSKVWAKLIKIDENSKEFILFSRIYAMYLRDTNDKRNLVYCLDSMSSIYFKVGFNEFEMMEIEDALNTFYFSVGMYNKSLELSEKNYERKVKNMGENHPVTIHSLYSRALIYAAMGRNVKALNINIESYSKAKETLGDSHPDTIANLDSLGNIYMNLEMFEGALEAKRKVFDQYVKVFGENHPKSVMCLKTIGNIYVGLGQFEKAEKILKAASKKLVAIFGVKSREATNCNEDLKKCQEERKRIEGKEKFY